MKTLHMYIDEAGRWPLASPLAVGIIIPIKKLQSNQIQDFKDSKKLSESQRENLLKKIQEMEKKKLILTKVSYASVKEIDKLWMTKAQALAIERWIKEICQLKKEKTKLFLHLDGNRDFWLQKTHPEWEIETIIKGDDKVKEISMASIIAKVNRDHLMNELPKRYQKYGFEQHKGYGTKMHREKIKEFWPCDLHRKLFLRKILPTVST